MVATVVTSSASDAVWKQYKNYTCDLATAAIDITYELSLTECYEECLTNADCKGISWYEYLKLDVDNDPSRCYLVNKICNLTYFILAPVITSFWYLNITEQELNCVDYPSLWADKFTDDCDRYEAINVCDNAFNDSSKAFILADTDAIYGFNAFQACCGCAGSLFQYNTYLMEPLWKPLDNANTTDNMVCQTYNDHYNDDFAHLLTTKWKISEFLGICNYITQQLYNKYSIIYSLSSNINENLQDFKQYDCVNNNIFGNTTFYICNKFDHNIYPYVIDITSSYSNIYLNGHFIDIDDFIEGIENNKVVYYDECNIAILINNNINSNVIGSIICEFLTFPPTEDPTIEPTTHPTKAPTVEPTINPSAAPTLPTLFPTLPTMNPTGATLNPTTNPSFRPTESPTSDKDQLTAFLLSLFFGEFGGGRFYVGDELEGSFKIVMLVLLCICICCAAYGTIDGEEFGPVFTVGAGCVCLGLIIWIIIDLVSFGNNTILDDNGEKLQPW